MTKLTTLLRRFRVTLPDGSTRELRGREAFVAAEAAAEASGQREEDLVVVELCLGQVDGQPVQPVKCDREAKALGLCSGHYTQAARGQPLRPLRGTAEAEKLADAVLSFRPSPRLLTELQRLESDGSPSARARSVLEGWALERLAARKSTPAEASARTCYRCRKNPATHGGLCCSCDREAYRAPSAKKGGA